MNQSSKVFQGMELSSEAEGNGCLYRIKCLHEIPALMSECCDLINMEWKRSYTARMRSIEGSNENFPMSLVLLKSNAKPEVVGHCKISRLSMSHTKVFVEAVVIHPGLRGKGLGKFLMYAAEEICKSKNIKWIYLATKGQEGFYQKLGYIKCAPVNMYGCQFDDSTEIIETEERKPIPKSLINNNASRIFSHPFHPPPPPPLPLISPKAVTNVSSAKIYMRKNLL